MALTFARQEFETQGTEDTEEEFPHCFSRPLPVTDKFNCFFSVSSVPLCFKFWIFVSPPKVSAIALTVAAQVNFVHF